MAMTLEEVRDGLRDCFIAANSDGVPFPHVSAEDLGNWCEALTAHLTQPAQAVDVGEAYVQAMVQVHEQKNRALSAEKAGCLPWISVEAQRPERNKPAIYWHKSEFGGFAAIADEWRDEHHLAYATHWLPYTAPASPTPDKEG